MKNCNISEIFIHKAFCLLIKILRKTTDWCGILSLVLFSLIRFDRCFKRLVQIHLHGKFRYLTSTYVIMSGESVVFCFSFHTKLFIRAPCKLCYCWCIFSISLNFIFTQDKTKEYIKTKIHFVLKLTLPTSIPVFFFPFTHYNY